MKRRIKIAISMGVLMAVLLARAVARMAGRPVRRDTVILYYHAVPRVQAQQFARQMALLSRLADVVPADCPGYALPARHGRGPAVAITFDDALDSVLDNALPVLASHGFPSTIFVPAGCMGEFPGWEMEGNATPQERVATPDRLRALPQHLVTIGSHTMSHPHLARLAPEAAQAEIVRSRDDLSHLLGRPVDLLAFPYGDYDRGVLAICKAAGFRHVFTIEPRPVRQGAGSWQRGRVAVDPDDGALEFYLKAMGAYRWMPWASSLKTRLLRHGS